MAKDIILYVDDDKVNISMVASIFEQDKVRVVDCPNGKEALAYLTKNHREVSVILIKMKESGDSGVLLKVLNTKSITKIIPVIAIFEEVNEARILECYNNGAADIFRYPLLSVIVRGRINNIIDQYNTKMNLESKVNVAINKLKEQNKELQSYNDKIIEVMSTIVEFRNLESDFHIKRIKKMTRVFAQKFVQLYGEEYGLNESDVDIIESASALHDIGKIVILDSILLKPGRLSPDEFEVIKSHTTMGCEVLNEIKALQDKKYYKVSYNIVRHHHERYDGKGYPDNLVGDNIPIEAQIVSVIDAYEALVGDKVYRDAFDTEKAYNMVMDGECGAFSKKILECLTQVRGELEKIAASMDNNTSK